jgi:tRNA uridine 5-carbamoylmethylation protein Kti12
MAIMAYNLVNFMCIVLFAIKKYSQRKRKLDYRENNPLYDIIIHSKNSVKERLSPTISSLWKSFLFLSGSLIMQVKLNLLFIFRYSKFQYINVLKQKQMTCTQEGHISTIG